MTVKFKGLQEMVRAYERAPAAIERAQARAVRRTGTTIVAQQSREIASTVSLKVGVIKKQIQTIRQPSAGKPQVVFEVREESISLIDYAGRGSSKSASVQVLKAGGRKTVKGGFITPSPQGSKQIWKRTGQPKRTMTAGRYRGKQREPIRKTYGPSVLAQYIKDAIQAVGEKTWNERLPIELDRETTFALKQLGIA